MTTTTTQSVTPPARPGPDGRLAERLSALDRLTTVGADRIDSGLLGDVRALLDRAGARLRLSAEHTVVALAGGTGSGKSSLFNAICGIDLSPVGVTRPTTSAAHACVWGLDGAGPLLDWLAIQKRHRYARSSALDNADEGSLRGLVLVDLPDHDSVRVEQTAEVDRLVGVADLLVFVLDPQKYADAAVHWRYFGPLAGHEAVTLVVLNQVDRLSPQEIEECVGDLRQLLESAGMRDPRILLTSATTGVGLAELRQALVDAVARRRAASERISADVDKLVARLTDAYGSGPPRTSVDEDAKRELIDSLSVAAGVEAVGTAVGSAYSLRAQEYVGWPFGRLVGRLRDDPLRRMRLEGLREELRGAIGEPVGAQQAEVETALHRVSAAAAAGLPPSWAGAVRRGGRENADEIPQAIGTTLVEALPRFNRLPGWWIVVRVWQWTLVAAVAAMLCCIGAVAAYGVAHVAPAPSPLLADPGVLPALGLMILGTLILGWLTATGCRNLVAFAADRQLERFAADMQDRLTRVAEELVIAPVERELDAYQRFGVELEAVRSPS